MPWTVAVTPVPTRVEIVTSPNRRRRISALAGENGMKGRTARQVISGASSR